MIAWGVDEMLLGALSVGATSAVGSTYNYAAGLYLRMIAAHRAGDVDTARQCAAQSGDMVAVLLKHGVLRTGKATMAMIGIDCGPTRSPVSPLTPEEITSVRRAYDRIGLFDPHEPAPSKGNGTPAHALPRRATVEDGN